MTRTLHVNALRTSAILALAGLAFVQCGGDKKPADSPTEVIPSAEPPQPEEADAATTRAASSPSDSATADSPPPPAETTPAPLAKADPLTDEQIATFTGAANTAEIAQAKLAQTKSKDPEVKRFAAMMISHHSQAQQKQARLKLKTADSGVLTALQADAASTLNALKADNGKDFDQAYISAQVDGHQKVLDAIDDQLPNVKNAELKSYLDELKPRVEEHLKQAKALQGSFDSKRSSVETSDHAG